MPDPKKTKIIAPELTWTGKKFESGIRIHINEHGMIESVERGQKEKPGDTEVTKIPGALLPGFVNAHSHAFQRGLRGRGETFPPSKEGGNFWSWREAMYQLVESMDAESIFDLSKQCFSEMLAAGITTVGEFHYLHHDHTLDGYSFDEIILKAANAVGIRIVLLNAYYKTGGIDKPPSGGQLRFISPSLESYWEQMDQLAELTKDNPLQTLGAVAHSIRAVPPHELVPLHQEANIRGLVFHMHLEEQRQELAATLDRYGKTPLALINEQCTVSPRFTAVHCTHSSEVDLENFIDRGGNLCLCPLTEANLGDGIPNLPYMHHRGGRICLGTDSNARLSFTEEMRWLELVQRLAREKRGVLIDEKGANAKPLLEIATKNGARSLGLKTGQIKKGHSADFLLLNLNHPTLHGWTKETLLESFILGAGNEPITGTFVGGNMIPSPLPGAGGGLGRGFG